MVCIDLRNIQGEEVYILDYLSNHLVDSSGYGGAKQRYKLLGYPSNYDFQAYSCAGYWKP